MESEFQAILDQLNFLLAQLEFRLKGLFLPGRRYQWIILALGVILGWIFRRWAGARLEARMRSVEGWSKWRLRAMVILQRRLGLIFFVAYAWIVAAIIQVSSGSAVSGFVVDLAARIATVMLLVSLAARLINNRLLRGVVKWALWIYIILYFLRILDPMKVFLRRVAIDIGDYRLSALVVLQALIMLGLFLAAARLITQATAARIRSNEHISPSIQVLAIKLLQVFLYGGAFFIGLDAAGFDLTGLAVLTGAIGIGVGFGLQKVVSNLISGVIILLDRSIKPGDVISLGETFGWVETLTARYVSITTRTGKEYLIPNEDLITGQVVNWSHSNNFVRLDLNFGTSYSDNWHRVRKVAVEAAESCDRVLSSQPPVCHIVNLGDSSIDYVLRFWISDPSKGLTNIRGNVYLALLDAFEENGISIPFPQREVRILDS